MRAGSYLPVQKSMKERWRKTSGKVQEALNSLGEADAMIAHVEFRVELSDEHVAKDPQRTIWWGNVERGKPQQAGGTPKFRNL